MIEPVDALALYALQRMYVYINTYTHRCILDCVCNNPRGEMGTALGASVNAAWKTRPGARKAPPDLYVDFCVMPTGIFA